MSAAPGIPVAVGVPVATQPPPPAQRKEEREGCSAAPLPPQYAACSPPTAVYPVPQPQMPQGFPQPYIVAQGASQWAPVPLRDARGDYLPASVGSFCCNVWGILGMLCLCPSSWGKAGSAAGCSAHAALTFLCALLAMSVIFASHGSSEHFCRGGAKYDPDMDVCCPVDEWSSDTGCQDARNTSPAARGRDLVTFLALISSMSLVAALLSWMVRGRYLARARAESARVALVAHPPPHTAVIIGQPV